MLSKKLLGLDFNIFLIVVFVLFRYQKKDFCHRKFSENAENRNPRFFPVF